MASVMLYLEAKPFVAEASVDRVEHSVDREKHQMTTRIYFRDISGPMPDIDPISLPSYVNFLEGDRLTLRYKPVLEDKLDGDRRLNRSFKVSRITSESCIDITLND